MINCEIFLKLLLLEYITAGGFSGMPLPTSLLHEGTLMRNALWSDFSALENIEIVTTCDARLDLPKLNLSNHHVAHTIADHSLSEIMQIWRNLIEDCDAVLVIAPETDGVLETLMKMVEESAVKNLGCTRAAVQIASNKYDTYRLLKSAGILTIPTYAVHEFLVSDFRQNLAFKNGCVIKPVDGAGCEDTLYFNDDMALRAWLLSKASKDLKTQAKSIIQPYQIGTPASLSILCKHGKALLLSCNQQMIEFTSSDMKHSKMTGNDVLQNQDGHASMHYKGCFVNGLNEHQQAFATLAKDIAAALPGLNGYIGVDVILNHDDIYVVEINPRITTSYIALGESIGINPAKLLLDLAYDESLNFMLPANMTAHTIAINLNE